MLDITHIKPKSRYLGKGGVRIVYLEKFLDCFLKKNLYLHFIFKTLKKCLLIVYVVGYHKISSNVLLLFFCKTNVKGLKNNARYHIYIINFICDISYLI